MYFRNGYGYKNETSRKHHGNSKCSSGDVRYVLHYLQTLMKYSNYSHVRRICDSSILTTACEIRSRSSRKYCDIGVWCRWSFTYPHRYTPHGVRSGDLGSQVMGLTRLATNNSFTFALKTPNPLIVIGAPLAAAMLQSTLPTKT
jgi:hypothetical protein